MTEILHGLYAHYDCDLNALPKELRANLISIGLWLLREAEDVRQGRSDNFDGLIEVSQIIRDGIQ